MPGWRLLSPARLTLTCQSPALIILTKTSCGIVTEPCSFSRLRPSFCFSRSFILRVISPPESVPAASFFLPETVRDEMIRPRALPWTLKVKSSRGKILCSFSTTVFGFFLDATARNDAGKGGHRLVGDQNIHAHHIGRTAVGYVIRDRSIAG